MIVTSTPSAARNANIARMAPCARRLNLCCARRPLIVTGSSKFVLRRKMPMKAQIVLKGNGLETVLDYSVYESKKLQC